MFSIDKISVGNSVLIVGRRNTGKTSTVLDILWHNRDIPRGLIVNDSSSEGRYKKSIPPQFIQDEYTEDIPRAVVRRQNAVLRKRDTGIDTRGFCVLDDCLYSSLWLHDKYIQYILKERQDLHLLFIAATVYGFGITPQITAAFDYVILGRDLNTHTIRRLHAQYAPTCLSYDILEALISRLDPSETTLLVIDNTTQSQRVEDRIFFYKPMPRPDLRLCERFAQVTIK
jgi:hypothetical protein